MRRAVRLGAILVAALLLAAALASTWLSRPKLQGELGAQVFAAMRLAPPDAALTLAVDNKGRVLLVTALDAIGVTAVDVESATGKRFADALAAYSGLGAAGLRELYTLEQRVSHSWESLGVPVPARAAHIAAGANYREHAREVGHDEDPFLFPKLSTPTAWNSVVPAGTRLDYEVELCAVLLADASPGQEPQFGYLLCGDFTDRWTLVRNMDLGGAMGRTGFAQAKGGAGRLPVGPLLVIPAAAEFAQGIELALYRNGALRQRDSAGSMIWDARELLARAIADCQTDYEAGPAKVRVAACKGVPAGTLVLTGTPGGVLFHVGTLWNPFAYLRPGDVVTSFGSYLGFTRNVVADEN